MVKYRVGRRLSSAGFPSFGLGQRETASLGCFVESAMAGTAALQLDACRRDSLSLTRLPTLRGDHLGSAVRARGARSRRPNTFAHGVVCPISPKWSPLELRRAHISFGPPWPCGSWGRRSANAARVMETIHLGIAILLVFTSRNGQCKTWRRVG